MCSLIAVRIISESGKDSILATISRASAWSELSRILIVFTCFIWRLLNTIQWLSTAVVSWYNGITQPKEVCAMSSEKKPDRPSPPHEHEFHIQIDRVHYTVKKEAMTGLELRAVPATPIGPDRDLFEVVPGGTDRKVGDQDVVEIRDGKRFFTAPAQINPGK